MPCDFKSELPWDSLLAIAKLINEHGLYEAPVHEIIQQACCFLGCWATREIESPEVTMYGAPGDYFDFAVAPTAELLRAIEGPLADHVTQETSTQGFSSVAVRLAVGALLEILRRLQRKI